MSKVLKPLTSETIDHVQTLIDDSVKYEILSIGVGVQSSTLCDEFERIDRAESGIRRYDARKARHL